MFLHVLVLNLLSYDYKTIPIFAIWLTFTLPLVLQQSGIYICNSKQASLLNI